MNKDYIFHINWEDRHKKLHRIGILAQIDEFFYLVFKDEESADSAYRSGFIGIPGFKQEEVYRSKELFDFFKSRILDKKSPNPCEELAQNRGISMIDSFSVDEVQEETVRKYREIILEAYELQERKNMLEKERNIEEINNKKTDSSDESRDIK